MQNHLLYPARLPQYLKLWEILKMSRAVLLIAHPKPDGDTLGAGLAMYQMLRTEPRCEVKIFCEDDPGPTLANLPFAHHLERDPLVLKKSYDITVVFDAGDLQYLKLPQHLSPEEMRSHHLLNIDHHSSNVYFGEWNIVEPSASSTCELLLDFFTANHLDIDKKIATCLLTGLITDTTGFSNLATTPHSLRAAGQLMRYGASVSKIAHQTINYQSLGRLKLWGRALSRLHRNPTTRWVTTIIRESDLQDCETTSDEIDGIANFLNTIEDADVILVYQERGGNLIKGSLRTTKTLIDVSKIAKLVGGGGHVKAAGFSTKGSLVFSTEGWKIKASNRSTPAPHLIFI